MKGLMWKITLFYKVTKYEIQSKVLEKRIARSWVRMSRSQEELDRIKAQSANLGVAVR